MDPLSPNLKEKMIGDDRCSPYRDILSDVANHFNLAMKLANPAWKDNIFDWHREFPTWIQEHTTSNNLQYVSSLLTSSLFV